MEEETVRDELHEELQYQVTSACVPLLPPCQVSSVFKILVCSQILKPILLGFPIDPFN